MRSLETTTPQERHIVGMAGIAHGTATQKPTVIALALKFLKAYQADPGCALPSISQPFGTGLPITFHVHDASLLLLNFTPFANHNSGSVPDAHAIPAVLQCRCSLTLHAPGAGLRTLALRLPSASCCWVTGRRRSARWASRLAQQPVMTHLLMMASLTSFRCAALWPSPTLLMASPRGVLLKAAQCAAWGCLNG